MIILIEPLNLLDSLPYKKSFTKSSPKSFSSSPNLSLSDDSTDDSSVGDRDEVSSRLKELLRDDESEIEHSHHSKKERHLH